MEGSTVDTGQTGVPEQAGSEQPATTGTPGGVRRRGASGFSRVASADWHRAGSKESQDRCVSARHPGHSAVRGHVRLPSPAQRATVPSVYGAERALSSAGRADVPDADEVVPPLPDFAPTDGSEARETGRVPMDAEPREHSGRGADGVGGDRVDGRVAKAIISWVGKGRGGVGRREWWRSSGCGMPLGAANGSLPQPYRVSGQSPHPS